MRDLKDTVSIEKRCAEANEPVFVTKNGYGRLVVMDIEYFERVFQKIYEAKIVNDGLEDVASNKLVDGADGLDRIRRKHGL